MNYSRYFSRSARIVLSATIACSVLAGCAGAPEASPSTRGGGSPGGTEASAQLAAAPGDEAFLTFEDDTDRLITLKQQPKRIVVLSPQLLDLFYEVGGEAVARTTTPGAQPPAQARELDNVGGMTSVNTEKLLSLKPDLVIGSPSFHRNLTELLAASDVPFAMFQLGTYKDLQDKARLLGQIAGSGSTADERLAQLEERIRQLESQVPADRKVRFAMLNVTPSSVSVQRTNTIGLEVAGMLRMENVAEVLEPSQNSATTAPYSLEKLVELDPDYIFILIHGAQEDGLKKLESELAAQPAWNSLKAVRDKRMTVLPSNLFLSNPGFALDQSVDYLARLIYPEIFGDAKSK